VHRPDVFQHLFPSIFSFNEEFGEATFGVQAKSVLSDADQYKTLIFFSNPTLHQQPQGQT